MVLAEFLPPLPNMLWRYALQMGIRGAIVKAAPELTGAAPPWDIASLRTIQMRFAEAGLRIAGMEGDQFDMSRIKLGLAGRDEDLERYCQMLRNMGELGIPLLCYNFMAVTGWYRTQSNVPGRGGALFSTFDLAAVERGNALVAQVSQEEIWQNYSYFLRAVMPAAEKVGVKMALHPDDPPIPALRGVSRIFGSPEAFDRAYSIAPSSSNGVTFCRANFKLMGADVPVWIRHFAQSKRLFYVHLRAVRGTPERFEEVFHDEASAELIETLQVCKEAGFTGPLRSDHVPTLAGETNDHPGYGALGRLFANGYILGLMDAMGIERSA